MRGEPLWVNPGWNNEWVPQHISLYLRGGGQEIFAGPPDGAGVYPRHWRTRAQLVRVSSDPIRYERRLGDGTLEVYALPDTAPVGERRVFLTEVRDAHGATVTLTYDAQYRLVALTDALGQVSTLSYDLADDARKVTAFTDPFGRAATLTYTPAGQLASITDVAGLTSHFAYEAEDFIGALTTPYGTTTFQHEAVDATNHPWIMATNPLGEVERVEYQFSTEAVAASVPGDQVPAGFAPWNTQLHQYVSLEWDGRAWAAGPGAVATATVTRWFLAGWSGTYSNLKSVVVPHSVQRPDEARVWYAYPGQNRTAAPVEVGWTNQPSEVARVRPDGTTQRTLVEYNDLGQVTSRTDPLGRTTTYSYAENGADLLEVRQVTPTGTDLLAQYGQYTAAHQPGTVTDAAGQTTTLTYTAAGHIATVTNARTETTTYGYDAQDRLATVTGPVAGATTTYTYDGYGRVSTVTDADGATLTTAYDGFDRPTRVTYPDETYEATTYDRLDVATRRDRAGRVTRFAYDRLRRLVATQDPAGRTVEHRFGVNWDQLIDAKGQTTTWERDVAGRVVREVRADGLTATVYTYDTLGRLTTVTDPKGQVTTYTYALDDAVVGLTWTNAAIATPAVSHTYDPVYPRVTTMTDGMGTTSYTYHPAGQAGAGQVATVDGPLADDVIAYSYDVLGRVVGRTIDGAAHARTLAYDALGRVSQEVNLLGTFTYGYDGVSGRLATVTYPNGQTSTYAYFPTAQDHRLQTIHHRLPDQTTLSRFDYAYDVVGNILTWQQQAGTAAPHAWRYGYDRADQLTSAVEETTDSTPVAVARYGYGYDPAGNRTSEQVDDQVTSWTHDPLNRLVTQQGGGVLRFAGTVNEPATVTVHGVPAPGATADAFAAGVSVGPGTTTVTIAATDGSGNAATAAYEVEVADAPKTFTYDANGNLTSDGARTFEWDARNQLVAVTVGTHRSEFVYDGLQRRVRHVEKDNGVTTSDTRVLWCETTICEERATDGVTVTRRAFGLGEQVNGTARFFTTDHLGSVREVTDGAVTLLARYAFDPWGRRTVTAGSDVTTVGFTGHRTHASSGLALALYRGYDAVLGRWVSEDPIGLSAGPNRFSYIRNRAVVRFDPLGLEECCGQKVTIWVCERPVDAWYGSFLPNHMYVCCGGPNVSCFGHQRNNLRRGEPIPPEGNATGTCRPVEVCQDVRKRKCENPTSPCNASTGGWNCRDWAQWDGRSPCPDPHNDFNGRGGVR